MGRSSLLTSTSRNAGALCRSFASKTSSRKRCTPGSRPSTTIVGSRVSTGTFGSSFMARASGDDHRTEIYPAVFHDRAAARVERLLARQFEAGAAGHDLGTDEHRG